MKKISDKVLIKYGKPFDMRVLDRGVEWRKEIALDQKHLADRMKGNLNRLDACPICDRAEVSTYTIVFGYPYGKCGFCGHIYCQTPPNAFAIENLYRSDSLLKSAQSKIYLDENLFLKRLENIARPKVNFVQDVINKLGINKSGKWVDIGSGAGDILLAAGELGWEALGVESDLEECNFAKSKGMKVLNEAMSEKNSASLLCDAQVVSLFNVLEHLPDPKGFLANIASALKEGFLVFEVPRHPSLSSLSAELFPDMACRHIYPPDHLHIFSENSIDALLKETGFNVVGKWYFGQDFFDLICSAGANQGLGPNSVWSAIAGIAPQIQQVIDDQGLSDSILVVAQYGGDK